MRNPAVAVVIGGTGDLGRAICKNLLIDGFRVYATGFSTSCNVDLADYFSVPSEMAKNIEISQLNVTDLGECEKYASDLISHYNSIDVLINCVGITNDIRFSKMNGADWFSVININLLGVFNITRQFVNSMIHAGAGRIINISSINAQKGQVAQTNYSAAKAGLHGFTKSLALELASKGVTVNTVSPGYIETRMVRKVPEHMLEKIVSDIPLKRLGRPEEVASLVSYLVSEHASYITGADISINGGLHMS